MRRLLTVLVLAALVAAACGGTGPAESVDRLALPQPDGVIADLGPATTVAPTTVAPATTTTAVPVVPATDPGVEARAPRQEWVPFGQVGDIVLHHPSDRVEVIGFHQSNHEGARRIEVLAGARGAFALPDRERASDQQSAADIAVAPDHEIHAPVTGTVLRATSYTLYCDKRDEFVVIEPDGHPGIEVKVLHIVGLQVTAGQRVEAGVTPIAERGRVLPFVSDVDKFTPEPSWPHTHVEVVDTSIRNVPSGNSGSENC